MEKKPNNPAAHLLELLKQLCAISPNTTSRQALATVFKLNANDTLKLLQHLGGMVELVACAEERVHASHLDVGLYLNWKPQVLEALGALPLSGNITGFVGPLTHTNSLALERLRFCADVLSRERPGKVLEDAELQEIQKDIEDLRNDIGSSDVDAELKLFMLYQLGLIRDAIDQYKFFGLGPLERATNETFGSLVLNPMALERMSGTPLREKFYGLLKRLATILAPVALALQIEESVKHLLLK